MDSIAFNLAYSQYQIGRKKDSSSLDLSRQSLQAQVGSINETQKQFAAINQPFLQATDVYIRPIAVNKRVEIEFSVENFSNIPAQVISQKNVFVITTTPPLISVFGNASKEPYESNFYLSKERKLGVKVTSNEILSIGEFNGLNDRDFYIYVWRKFRYKNLVTGKFKIYEVYLKLKPVKDKTVFSNGTYYEFLYNENYEEKSPEKPN